MTSFGERLASVRKRRGLTQRELASESGVSVSLIRQLEQGHLTATRADTARKLAVALRVLTTDLMPRDETAEAVPQVVEEWTSVRRALEGRRIGSGGDAAPTYAGVAATLETYKPFSGTATFAEVRMGLPSLLNDADDLVSKSVDGAKVEARRLRSRVRQMTAWLMTQTWQLDTADLAIQLALDDAPDIWTAAPAIDFQCWSLVRRGDFKSARKVAAKWADDIEPIRISRASKEDLSAWGLVLLKVSSSAARDNRPGESDDALSLAQVAAMALRRRHENGDGSSGFLHAFGPTYVAMLKAECAMIVDRPEITLATAERLTKHRHPLPWVWNRHRLDVANAHVSMKQHGEAVNVLREIHSETPEWLVNQRYAGDVLGKVIHKRRTLTPEMRELADFMSLPY